MHDPLQIQHLLRYLIPYLPVWQQFYLIEPRHDAPPESCRLDIAVVQYLRSREKHPLFDGPVVIWWSDADHALLVPCCFW